LRAHARTTPYFVAVPEATSQVGGPRAGDRRGSETVQRPLCGQVLRWSVLGLGLGAFVTFWPFWTPLVLAAWFANILGPLHVRLARWMRKNERGAAAATVLLVIMALAPIVVVVLSLAAELTQLAEKLTESRDYREALLGLIRGNASPQSPAALDVGTATDLARSYGASAFGMVTRIAGATAVAVIRTIVFVYGFYVFLAHGHAIYAWVCRHAPLARRDVARFAAAFTETGRGLLVGFGLTAAAQGAVATIGYLVIGLPHALVLGLLTAIASFIPAVGTGLVWIPLAIGLVLEGEIGRAVGVLVIGAVISIGDNFLRPALSRYGRLELPMFALFVAMLGGFFAFGAWGLILGPLLVRLFLEGLELLRERRARSRRRNGVRPHPEI
jgi:predicted PurR-regulated permease PerM